MTQLRSHLVPGPIQERTQLAERVEALEGEVTYLTARLSALEIRDDPPESLVGLGRRSARARGRHRVAHEARGADQHQHHRPERERPEPARGLDDHHARAPTLFPYGKACRLPL